MSCFCHGSTVQRPCVRCVVPSDDIPLQRTDQLGTVIETWKVPKNQLYGVLSTYKSIERHECLKLDTAVGDQIKFQLN